MPEFALTLINPEETSLETFDYDDDLWTPTDAAKVTVERYEGDADRDSCMRFYGVPMVLGEVNPYTGLPLVFGDDGPGLLPIQFGDSYKGVDEGVYKDYTVVPGMVVHLSSFVRLMTDNSAILKIYALDHTNADAVISGGSIGTWDTNEWQF